MDHPQRAWLRAAGAIEKVCVKIGVLLGRFRPPATSSGRVQRRREGFSIHSDVPDLEQPAAAAVVSGCGLALSSLNDLFRLADPDVPAAGIINV